MCSAVTLQSSNIVKYFEFRSTKRVEQNLGWNKKSLVKSISYTLFQLFQQKTGGWGLAKLGIERPSHSVQNHTPLLGNYLKKGGTHGTDQNARVKIGRAHV